MSMCLNVREILDYVVTYMDEYVYECEKGSRLCCDIYGFICV